MRLTIAEIMSAETLFKAMTFRLLKVSIILSVLFSTAITTATAFYMKVDEDSDGPKCVLYQFPEDVMISDTYDGAIIYASILSFNPLNLEISYRFPHSSSFILDPKIMLNDQKIDLFIKGRFGWIKHRLDEKKLQRQFLKGGQLSVLYTIDGRSRIDKFSLDEFKKTLIDLQKNCKLSA